MGCILSKIDKKEIVQQCKERKRLMKQLLRFRAEFAVAQMAYLRSLRNTGITLRQFTEGDSLELEEPPFRQPLPPPPPPPLPPSPPPPPSFSPDDRRIYSDDPIEKPLQQECIEIDEDSDGTPHPSSVQSLSWNFWDPFDPSSSLVDRRKNTEEARQAEDDEDWEETKTEFEEEQEDGADLVAIASKPLPKKSPPRELMDDNSSTVSWYAKDTTDMAMVVWRNKKTMAGIVKELDDYFLKASEGVKEIGVLLEANNGGHLPQSFGEAKMKSCKSAKVFNALSWSWSSKSLLTCKDASDANGANEVEYLGSLSKTLDKLSLEEQRLYEEVKEEETAKLQLEKKITLLQKQESEDQDWTITEKMRSNIESLQNEILCLHQSISRSCLLILKIRDEELYPQLLELSFGFMQMWKTMYECHQAQNYIAQQFSHLNSQQNTEPTTDYNRQATAQLEAELSAWFNTFSGLLSSQRAFVHALYQWVELTNFLPDSSPNKTVSEISALCEEWHLALEKLPDEVAADAIKSFKSGIHSIVLQQAAECSLQKRCSRLEKKLDKQLNLLTNMEKKLAVGLPSNRSGSSPNNPSSVEHVKLKTQALKKKAEEEKAKYLNSVLLTQAMTLNNLQTGLPNVFQATMGFASVFAQAFEAVEGHAKSAGSQGETMEPVV